MGIIYAEQVDCMSLDSMQETHEREIKILNDIDKLATKHQLHKTEPDELIAKIEEYIVHVKEHFASEERLMEKYDFPSYDMHKTAHDMFLADLDYATKQWKRSGNIEKITNFVRKTPEWIVLHVNTVDTPTANYLVAKIEKESK